MAPNTTKQKISTILYLLLLKISGLFGKRSKILINEKETLPVISVYDLSIELITGEQISLAQFEGKKMLFVNTASNCGYTAQYKELQELHRSFEDQLVIFGFPTNDFKQQEKGSNEAIQQFCSLHYGVSFPLAKKSIVVKGANQNKVYQWLTDTNINGWNNQQPGWNFAKYLINETGMLTHYFDTAVSPLSKEVINAITDK